MFKHWIMGYDFFKIIISKTQVCCWRLVFTTGPFLGKKHFGYRENQETLQSSEKLHWLASVQLQSPLVRDLQEQQEGQGGFALVFMHMLWGRVVLYGRGSQRELAGPDLMLPELSFQLAHLVQGGSLAQGVIHCVLLVG